MGPPGEKGRPAEGQGQDRGGVQSGSGGCTRPEDLELYRRNIGLLEDRVRVSFIARDIEPAILEALRRVPRHLFVHPSYRAMAYTDNALPTLSGMTTTSPSLVCLMVSLAGVRAGYRVLEVGTGTGYQAAILATLGARVISIERRPELAAAASRALEDLGLRSGDRRVRLFRGDGAGGYPSGAPYHSILVAAAVSEPGLLGTLAAQLDPGGGRLVAPVGRTHDQVLTVLRRSGRATHRRIVEGVSVDFVPLA